MANTLTLPEVAQSPSLLGAFPGPVAACAPCGPHKAAVSIVTAEPLEGSHSGPFVHLSLAQDLGLDESST